MRITKNEVVALYVSERKSTREIADVAGVTPRYILHVLAENDVDIVARRRSRYTVDVDFFKVWTPEMAYVTGFVLTDGTISGNQVSIAQKDAEILSHISDALGSNYPVKKRANGKSFIYMLTISRKEIVKDLAQLGIGEKKSLTVGFPNVPAEYMHHFVRGVVDGDGWVQDRGYVMNVTSGSELFANKLCEVLTQLGFNSRVAYDGNIYRVWVSGKEDITRLGKWLYEDCGNLFLPRKKRRFQQRLIG